VAAFDDLIPSGRGRAAAGAFDDLIPAQGEKRPAGAFDDLIPERPSMAKIVLMNNPLTAAVETGLNLASQAVALPVAGIAGLARVSLISLDARIALRTRGAGYDNGRCWNSHYRGFLGRLYAGAKTKRGEQRH